MKPTMLLFIVLFSVFCILPISVYANSAEPPALIVIIKNAPADVSVSIISDSSVQEGRKTHTAWETYYSFYQRELDNDSAIELKVYGNGTSYDQTVDKQYLNGYNSIITLDFTTQNITEGKLLSRSILLVSMRVVFTLVIEGAVFFLFGFRKKHSWLVFLIMNLLTQGTLNIVLNGISPFASYRILNLLFMEFWIFIAETLAALAFIKEHRKLRRVSYVLAANLLSLVLGSYLITVLPV